MNIPGHTCHTPQAGPAQSLSGPLSLREQEHTPYLQLHNTLGIPFPSPLLRQIEGAILHREGMHADEEFLVTTADFLTSLLQPITMDCSMDTFWNGIRDARLWVDTLCRTECSETGMVRNWPPGPQADVAGIPSGRTFTPPSLQQLAQDRIAGAMHGTHLLANRIASQRTSLAQSLLHAHISEFSAATKQCRPDLWQLSVPLDHTVSTYANAAKSIMTSRTQAELVNSPDLLRGICNMLLCARMHASLVDDAPSPPGTITSAEQQASIAIEDVYHHFATLFGDSRQPLPAWPQPQDSAGMASTSRMTPQHGHEKPE